MSFSKSENKCGEIITRTVKYHWILKASELLVLKSNNQNSIALTNNLVLHCLTKYVDIQHYDVYKKVTD